MPHKLCFLLLLVSSSRLTLSFSLRIDGTREKADGYPQQQEKGCPALHGFTSSFQQNGAKLCSFQMEMKTNKGATLHQLAQ